MLTHLYITGATGFVGRHLVQCWLAKSAEHRVICQTRRGEAALRVFAKAEWPRISTVTEFDQWQPAVWPDYGVVNLAGAPIAEQRWTAGYRAELARSRIQLTERLVASIERGAEQPRQVISASAIGFYGCDNRSVDEAAGEGVGFAASLCSRWEAAAAPLAAHCPLSWVRLGVVLGKGGALDKLLPLYRLGLGGPIGRGRQGFSWVHIDDVVAALLMLLDGEPHAGVYNLCAPTPLPQREFANALARALGRPGFLVTPSWVLRLVFGQMAEELLIGGQFVLPTRLLAEGFEFRYPRLDSALAHILG